MLKDNDQSIIKALRIYQNDMLDNIKPLLPFEDFLIFIRSHLCLGLIYKRRNEEFSVENIINDIENSSTSETISEIHSIFYDLGLKKSYYKILKSDNICLIIDEKTKNVINALKDTNKNIQSQMHLLDFFTKSFDNQRNDTLSSIGLDQFIDQLA